VADAGFEEGGFRLSTRLCAGENFGNHTHFSWSHPFRGPLFAGVARPFDCSSSIAGQGPVRK
jgi:hypothetical protein